MRSLIVHGALAAVLVVASAYVLQAQPATPSTRVMALVGLARTARDQGRVDEAVRHFTDADEIAPFRGAELVEYFWAAHRAAASEVAGVGQRVLAANPRETRVRDGLIGLAATARNEAQVRTLALGGAAEQPGLAVWPRRLAESYLRAGEAAAAAAAFRKAARLTGAEPADLAQAAMALEMAGDRSDALAAWDESGPEVWSTRAAWMESRTRALGATPAPARPAPRPKTPAEIVSASARALVHTPCAADPLAALEALKDAAPFLDAVGGRPTTCPDQASWTSRAVERAIGDGAFGRALALARGAASLDDAPIELREQLGVLLHWTGLHAEAEPVLSAVIAREPSRVRAGLALVEARRAIGDADGAWELAASYWSAASPATDRMTLAELALETGRVHDAFDLARALQDDPAVRQRARAVVGSALLAMGRPAEAVPILEELVPAPGPSLAWLDALAATEGVVAAATKAAGLPEGAEPAWADVLARRAVWQLRLGHPQEAQRLVAALDGIDPVRARLARGEMALASGRPADAERALREALQSAPRDLRALDMLTTALAEQGRWDEAFSSLASLRTRRPHDVRWAVREAEWRHRQAPSSQTLATLESLARDAFQADARSALARAYFRTGQYDRALETLGPMPSILPEYDVVLAARCLRGANRPADAVKLLRLRAALPVDGLLLRAELVAGEDGPLAARDEFVQLTSRPDADPDWYLAWAGVQTTGTELVRVLAAGATRFPESAIIQERLAVAAWAARDRDVALRAADAALAVDELRTGAWFVRVELASTAGPARALEELLGRFETRFADAPSVRIGMADMLAGLTRQSQDPAAVRALGWIESILADQPEHAAATVTEARLHAAMGRLSHALGIIDALVEKRPELPAALKLKAELLAAGGRYREAVEAFDRYLALAPRDLPARRQQARIDGWRGAFDESMARYRRLSGEEPVVPAVVAEAEAKRAYYHGQWSEALTRYNAWLALEPDDVEAQLERAQIFDRLGDPARAAEAFRVVAAGAAPNDVSLQAADRIERRRRATVDLFALIQSADAVERRQLLDLVDSGAAVSDDLGLGYGTRARVFGGPSIADVGDRVWRGHHVGGQMATTLAAPLRFGGSLAYRKLDPVAAQWFGDAALTWRAQSTLRVTAGVERALLLENGSTLADGISGVGPTGGARWTPNLDFALQVTGSESALSDGNRRRLIRLSASERVMRGANELKLVAASEYMAYREDRPSYFTPAGFWRHDVGAEWRGWVAAPRFFGDRERWVSAAYLFGVDSLGEPYHTGRLGISYELASGLSMVADGQLIRSPVFHGGRLSLGLRFRHVALPEL